MSTWVHAASLLMLWTVSSSGFNISVLVIRDRKSSSSENLPQKAASTINGVRVYIEDDVSIFTFWQTDYKLSSNWLVVLDTRIKSCPYQLFQKKLLGYITLYPGTCDWTDNVTSFYSVQTTPFDYRQLVVDIGNKSGSQRHSVALLFDETAKEYQQQISLTPFRQFLFNLELTLSHDHISEVLANLTVKTDVIFVFLMATSSSIEYVLQEASRLNMLCGRYHWLLFATDGNTPQCQSTSDHSIVLIKDPHNMMIHHSEVRLMKLLDNVIKDMTDVISGTSDPVCDCSELCNTCVRLFRSSLYKMADSGTGVFLRDDEAVNSVDLQLYNYAGNTSDSLIQVATWNQHNGVSSEGKLFVRGSKRVVLRVAAVVEPPFVFRNKSGGYYGYSIDVLDAIADIVNFTYTVKECDDGHYGNLNDESEWTGCIRNIINGDSDIIAGALTVTADREAVVDFTLPYYDFAGIQIVMKKQSTDINLFYFADVFTPLAWLCLGVVIAVTSFLLLLLDRYAPSSRTQTNEDGTPQFKTFDLKESIWFVMGSLTMTGAGAPPHSFSARLLVAGFWFFSVIMMSTFTANLAAFLTVSRMGVTINSMSELASQSDIKYSVISESSVMTYFQRMATIEENFYSIWKEMSLGGLGSNNSLAVWDYPLGDKYVNIWKNIKDTGLLNSTDHGVSKITQENFAFITDSPIIKYLTYRNCDLTAIGDMFSIRPYAYALKEKSIYTKKISSAILELQKRRALEALKRRWWDEGKKDCPASATDKGLDLQSLTGSFIVVAVGIASGILVLTLEHFWNRLPKRKPAALQVKPSLSATSMGDVSRNTEVTVLGDRNSTEELTDLPD